MEYFILSLSIINFLLGLIILIHSNHQKENIIFLFFAFCVSIWTLNNFYLRISPDVEVLRISYALGSIVALSYLMWVYSFLGKKISFLIKFIIIPFAIALFAITLFTNFMVRELHSINMLGYEGELGSLFSIYSFYFTIIIFLAIYNLIMGRRETSDPLKKKQITSVVYGALFFACVSFVVSFWIPVIFNTLKYTVLDNFSFSVLFFCIVYAMVRNQLFINRKVIVTEIFVFTLWISLFVRTIVALRLHNTVDVIANSIILLITVIIGIFLIRSVIKEVQLREKVEKQEKELERANEEQTSLIHFISHEIKGFLTKSRNIFSVIIDEDYGPTPEYLKVPLAEGLESGTKGVAMVQEILSASNLKKGTIEYKMIECDIAPMLRKVVDGLRGNAEARGITLEATIPNDGSCIAMADCEQMTHAFKNLIDNSIKYTLKGGVFVTLALADNTIRMTVKDTGVGISEEDKPRLFTEGGKGKNSLKVNVESTGYGLYITKKIVTEHQGRIWVDSEGEGKGSTFTIELPAKK